MALSPGKYVIESETKEGRSYTLTINKRGRGFQVMCSCPGFRRHKHCKHATAAKSGEYSAA
jgi:uncharacterized Zn finger protein